MRVAGGLSPLATFQGFTPLDSSLQCLIPPAKLSSFLLPVRRSGKFLGGLSSLSAPELGAVAIRAALERSRVPATDVEEVIMGNVIQGGVGQAPARQAAIKGGVPATVSALTINKVCGSGLKAA